jgi:DNA-directed RNA polymerase specialized sigma24 family protein
MGTEIVRTLGKNNEYCLKSIETEHRIDFYLDGNHFAEVAQDTLLNLLRKQAMHDYAGSTPFFLEEIASRTAKDSIRSFRPTTDMTLIGLDDWKTRHHPYAIDLAKRLVHDSGLNQLVDGVKTPNEVVDKIAEMIVQVASSNGWAEQAAREAVETLTAKARIPKKQRRRVIKTRPTGGVNTAPFLCADHFREPAKSVEFGPFYVEPGLNRLYFTHGVSGCLSQPTPW